ncbi:MAG: prepilin-type N-terminal cleavage/methylation domain-containing protein [Pseudohongiellaceae bacterium]
MQFTGPGRLNEGARGFSIVELIVVIAILGILARSALSRFLDVSDEARIAVIEQTATTVGQGALNARIKWLVAGKPQGTSANQGPQVDLGGTLVRVDPGLGYPVGNGGTDTADAMSLNDCIAVFNQLLTHSFTLRRRNQVDDNNFKDFDILVTRNNTNPDVCNYYWTYSTTIRPPGGVPGVGSGFRYFPGTGETEVFNF